jgi:hypothetical protein
MEDKNTWNHVAGLYMLLLGLGTKNYEYVAIQASNNIAVGKNVVVLRIGRIPRYHPVGAGWLVLSAFIHSCRDCLVVIFIIIGG